MGSWGELELGFSGSPHPFEWRAKSPETANEGPAHKVNAIFLRKPDAVLVCSAQPDV
jgi:hypothetical protein